MAHTKESDTPARLSRGMRARMPKALTKVEVALYSVVQYLLLTYL